MAFRIRQPVPPTFVVSELCCEETRCGLRTSDCAYQVAWTINPHMKVGAVNWRRARAQHRLFRRALRAAGAHLLELPFVHGAYDCVFAKDNALLLEKHGQKRALLASPVFRQRQQEQQARARVLDRLGFDIFSPPPVAFEGGDLAMLPGGRGALLGYGQRSSRRAAVMLEIFLDAPVTPLELKDPHLYHLDTALHVLSDGTALVCPDAFTPAALRTLERTEGIRQVLSVPREEALGFGLNLVEVGATVFVGARTAWVQTLLRAQGRCPVELPLDQFHLAGGSAACLVSQLHPAGPAVSDARPRPTSRMRPEPSPDSGQGPSGFLQ
ncbi:N-Dimethylarginine dimethylaminohydrolase [Stigmatella aurantiaca]|uniref:N-Dimethylarginine dimethylaminohydrolase n=2 Tax=Stigmatella aurantiaca TaxID=41 RepID=A0A1H8DVR7_STIAU|nr:N-Dimethylarginine dimethylaminohydrolase [Stigmatella aurantiaca]